MHDLSALYNVTARRRCSRLFDYLDGQEVAPVADARHGAVAAIPEVSPRACGPWLTSGIAVIMRRVVRRPLA